MQGFHDKVNGPAPAVPVVESEIAHRRVSAKFIDQDFVVLHREPTPARAERSRPLLAQTRQQQQHRKDISPRLPHSKGTRQQSQTNTSSNDTCKTKAAYQNGSEGMLNIETKRLRLKLA